MRFAARRYLGKSGAYIAIYNFYPDIYMACPDSLEGKASRMVHATYRYGGHGGAIDVFRLNENIKKDDIRELRFEKRGGRYNSCKSLLDAKY